MCGVKVLHHNMVYLTTIPGGGRRGRGAYVVVVVAGNGGGLQENVLRACYMQMPNISKMNYEVDARKIVFA